MTLSYRRTPSRPSSLPRALSATLTLLMCLAFVLPAAAKGPGGPGGPDGVRDPATRDKLHRAMRADLMRNHVGLTEAKAVSVEQLLDQFEPQEKALRETKRSHMKALRQLIESDSNDDAAYRQAVDGLLATQKKLAQMRFDKMKAVQKVLSGKEQAKLLHALGRMKKMKKHRKGKKGRRGGPGAFGNRPGKGGFGGE